MLPQLESAINAGLQSISLSHGRGRRSKPRRTASIKVYRFLRSNDRTRSNQILSPHLS
jgi:hypothetical protein